MNSANRVKRLRRILYDYRLDPVQRLRRSQDLNIGECNFSLSINAMPDKFHVRPINGQHVPYAPKAIGNRPILL